MEKNNIKSLGICFANNIVRFDFLPINLDLYLISEITDGYSLQKDYSKIKYYYTSPGKNVTFFRKVFHGLKFTKDIFWLSKIYEEFVFITPPYFHFLAYFYLWFKKKNIVTIGADAYFDNLKDKSYDNIFFWSLRLLFFWLLWIQEYVAIKLSSKVFINSRYVYEKYKRWNSSTEYTPNGPSVKKIRSFPTKKFVDGNYLIYVGGFSYYRGIDIMIKAFNIVRNKGYDDLKFVLMGKHNLNNLWNELFESEGVVLADQMPYDKMIPYIKGAKIAVSANRKTIASKLISSSKTFQYVACEIPQITTFGDHIYWIEKFDVGLIAEPTPESFAEAIISLLKNDELYAKFKNNCKKHSMNIDYTELLKPTIEYFNNYERIQIK